MSIDIKKLTKWAVAASVMVGNLFLPLQAQAEDTVKIGANYELSGDAASYGQQMLEGLELAVDQVNQAGGVNGQRVEIIHYDNRSDITESASVAQRLVSDGVAGVVGPALTGTTEAQIPILTKAGIPNVLPAATGDDLTFDSEGNILEYIFRVCFKNSYQGRIGAVYADKNLSAKKAVVFVDQSSDYSRGLADNFIDEFQSRGGKIVKEESFTAGDTDYSAILTSIQGQEFDCIYIPAYYTESGLIIKQAREMGINQAIIGSDGFSSEVLVELAGPENCNNVFYTDHFSVESDEPAVQTFMEAFHNKFGKQGGTWSALGFDAAMLIIDAMERSGSNDPAAITQAIADTEAFEGVTGTLAIDKEHNPVKPAVMIGLENGKIVSAENISVE